MVTSPGTATRDNILRAARPLFDQGEHPSVAEIAAAARVSRATFHRVVGTRTALLEALELDPNPNSRQRILAAAIEAVGRVGLAGLSMDELAMAAGVSRASLYRLFPGKPALFRELVRVYSPMETAAATIERMAGRSPDEVMPILARAVAHELRDRTGLVRALLFEATSMAPDTLDGVDFAVTRGVRAILAYIVEQMEAGRLRPMHPVLAMQSFIGPIMVHLLTRQLAETRLGLDIAVEDAAEELARGWVRGMQPEVT
jgi:AcrR family transcriptional regulator